MSETQPAEALDRFLVKLLDRLDELERKVAKLESASAPPTPTLAYLTTREVAKKLNVCTHTILRFHKRGMLKAHYLNSRCIRFNPEDVEKLIAKRKA